MKKKIAKEYSNNEITVVWKPHLCIHSANCVKGLPTVFNNRKKPWINIDGAAVNEIVDQVAKCPSGALSIKESIPEMKIMKTSDVVIADTKPVKVELKKDKNVAWCACGRSVNQPWCDGSHKSTSINPIVIKVEENKNAFLCMCKHSKNKPYCDGSHMHLKG
jgi:CDGSH-type Zn-finger protein/uncharacterized Fe-S cluster protein YjdI